MRGDRWTRLLAGAGVPLDGSAREQLLSDYFADYVDSTLSSGAFLRRNPRRSLGALVATLCMPLRRADLGPGVEADEIRAALTHKRGFGRLPVHELCAVLELPATGDAYAWGPERSTLRRQIRKAERLGLTWTRVDRAERADLLDQATWREQNHPDASYRTPGNDNARLLDHRLWLVARSPSGAALLLSITPVDGRWASLTYFRTLEDSPAASAARWLMSQVLVDELVARGVQHLVDSSSPIGLSKGLRQFQRLLGYRLVRVRPGRSAPRAP